MDIGVARTGSPSNRTNDRLQERLARAIAAKSNAQKAEKADSLALSSGVPSRTASPLTASESPRGSVDAVRGEDTDTRERSESQSTIDLVHHSPAQLDTPSIAVQPGTPGLESGPETQHELNTLTVKQETEPIPRTSAESTRSSLPRESLDSIRQAASVPRLSTELPSNEFPNVGSSSLKPPAEYDGVIKQLQSDFEAAELQRQEEVHGYIERIDALQSKLQYLARESAETARKASGAAPSGSLEKKLADKEEQVALLMEEGQSLSKKELAHLTTIKKLRAKIQEDGKELAEAKRRQEKSEKDVVIITERLKKAESSEKRLAEKNKIATQLQRDIESLRIEKDAKDSIIADLRTQLEESTAQQNHAEAKIAHEALELEKKKVADLEDDLANLKIEKSLVADRAQAQVKELKEKIDKEAERARITELEMKTEQQMLESKLELMRARAEEVSSGATGDAQAKLLRQIETLQTQYAVASENWQGIEASLIARATNLEKERDEATRREADIRRKAREVVSFISK
jgi:DNA repair exonuclease SbcCD ATPase subunit